MLVGPRWDSSRLLARDGADALYAVPNADGLCLLCCLVRGQEPQQPAAARWRHWRARAQRPGTSRRTA